MNVTEHLAHLVLVWIIKLFCLLLPDWLLTPLLRTAGILAIAITNTIFFSTKNNCLSKKKKIHQKKQYLFWWQIIFLDNKLFLVKNKLRKKKLKKCPVASGLIVDKLNSMYKGKVDVQLVSYSNWMSCSIQKTSSHKIGFSS